MARPGHSGHAPSDALQRIAPTATRGSATTSRRVAIVRPRGAMPTRPPVKGRACASRVSATASSGIPKTLGLERSRLYTPSSRGSEEHSRGSEHQPQADGWIGQPPRVVSADLCCFAAGGLRLTDGRVDVGGRTMSHSRRTRTAGVSNRCRMRASSSGNYSAFSTGQAAVWL